MLKATVEFALKRDDLGPQFRSAPQDSHSLILPSTKGCCCKRSPSSPSLSIRVRRVKKGAHFLYSLEFQVPPALTSWRGSNVTSSFKKSASSHSATFSLAIFVFIFCVSQKSAREASDANTGLNDRSVEVIQRLSSLDTLPIKGWVYHEGDVAHGESPTLDDSGWAKEKRANLPPEAIWFRRWIEVPKSLNGYDLTGSRIWFQMHAGADGPIPQIIYFNGRRIAHGDDLEPIVMFEPAHPGEEDPGCRQAPCNGRQKDV